MHNKAQILAKFENILLVGFIANLKFRKFKLALNPTLSLAAFKINYFHFSNHFAFIGFLEIFPFDLNYSLDLFIFGFKLERFCDKKQNKTKTK